MTRPANILIGATLPVSSDAQQAAFLDDCFRAWLNRIDARMGYDARREASAVATWRACFEVGMSENEAIAESATWLPQTCMEG